MADPSPHASMAVAWINLYSPWVRMGPRGDSIRTYIQERRSLAAAAVGQVTSYNESFTRGHPGTEANLMAGDYRYREWIFVGKRQPATHRPPPARWLDQVTTVVNTDGAGGDLNHSMTFGSGAGPCWPERSDLYHPDNLIEDFKVRRVPRIDGEVVGRSGRGN